MSVTDQLLENNEKYAASFDGPLPLPPAKHVAVLACMDARLDVHDLLGLDEGDAHVIRNAGGVATDDAIRSLAISQRLLGTREIVLIHHTDCGMLTFTDDDFKAGIQQETGLKPAWSAEAFDDVAPTCDSRSAGSRPTRSSRTATRCVASSSTWRPGASRRSPSSRKCIRPGDLIRRRAKIIGPCDALRSRDPTRRVGGGVVRPSWRPPAGTPTPGVRPASGSARRDRPAPGRAPRRGPGRRRDRGRPRWSARSWS